MGAQGNGASAGTRIAYGRDFTIDMSSDEIETTSRDTAPWKDFEYGLQEWSITFDLIYRNDDAATDLMESAFYSQTVLSAKLVDADGEGLYGDVIVTAWPKVEPLGDVMARSITLRGKGAPTRIDTVS